MKTSYRIFFLVLMLIFTNLIYGQTTGNDNEVSRLRDIISSQNYRIEVDRAYPRRSGAINLTTIYSLEVRNDSVSSWLPFFGRGFSVPYGGGQGLNFDAPISNYKVSYNRKGRARITFNTRTNEDSYRFTLEIFPNGAANVNVTMTNRESINFSGNLLFR